jgi:hypothetical protein
VTARPQAAGTTASRPELAADSWHLLMLLDQAPGLHALADTLADLADEGRPVVACTADLKYSNGLVRFKQRHPERFFQFGISEQSMVSAAAGMAAAGLRPYVATFASFLALLCCEQIRTDVAYTGLPVRLVGHHAGITLGFYGTSHHATEDLAIMRAIAGLFGAALFVELSIATLGSGLQLVDTGGRAVQADFGSPAAIGELLLTKFLLSFEVASFLLLVAAVGAVVLARRRGGLSHVEEQARYSAMDMLRPAYTGTMAEAVGGRHTLPGATVTKTPREAEEAEVPAARPPADTG